MTTTGILAAMPGPNEIRQWVIYYNPADYPGKYVVREWAVIVGQREPIAAVEAAAVVDTIEAARAVIPPAMVDIGRRDDDDPVIVEVWT